MKIPAPSASMVQSMLLRLSMILRTRSSAVHSTREETHALLKFLNFICCSQYTASTAVEKRNAKHLFIRYFNQNICHFKKRKKKLRMRN